MDETRKTLSAPALYVLAALAAEGETGWTEAPDSDVAHGSLRLVKGGEYIHFSHRFNSGDPMWWMKKVPKRLRGSAAFEPFRFTPRQGERT